MNKVERGQAAKTESAVMAEAFEAIEADYIAAWKLTKPEDVEKRENIFQKLQALSDVRLKLASFVLSGEIELANIR